MASNWTFWSCLTHEFQTSPAPCDSQMMVAALKEGPRCKAAFSAAIWRAKGNYFPLWHRQLQSISRRWEISEWWPGTTSSKIISGATEKQLPLPHSCQGQLRTAARRKKRLAILWLKRATSKAVWNMTCVDIQCETNLSNSVAWQSSSEMSAFSGVIHSISSTSSWCRGFFDLGYPNCWALKLDIS